MQIRNISTGVRYLALLAAAGTAYAASLSNADKRFMEWAAKVDMTEAHEGQLAENQASRADVKTFAKTLVQDHTASYTQLSELAAKDGFAIPKGIDARKDQTIEQLVHLKGDHFDRQFTRDEIAAHRHAIAVFKREAQQGRDTDVKDYAGKMIPILEKHLHVAEECAKVVGHS